MPGAERAARRAPAAHVRARDALGRGPRRRTPGAAGEGGALTAPARAWVSIGTNLGDRAAHLLAAAGGLAALPRTRLVAVSPIFETEPVGPPPQGPYLNAAAELATGLAPEALLDALLAIEAAEGRERGAERNRARTLDLDLLLYDGARISTPRLELPHPRLAERPFVLEPLAALAGDVRHPVLGDLVDALAERVRDPRTVRPWPGDDAAFRRALAEAAGHELR